MDNQYEDIKEPKDDKDKFIDKHLFQVMKRRVGRPKKYLTPEQLAFKAVEFFAWCVETKNKVTFAGLRLWIDFQRETWSRYKNDESHKEFRDTILHIEQMLEAEWEAKLGWAGSTQGAIFWLKNKAGWKDEITQNQLVTTAIHPQAKSNDTPPLAGAEEEVK